MSKTLIKIKATVDEKLQRFSKLIDIVKGRQDSQVRAGVILNPIKPSTTTNLTSNQVDFIAISKSITKYFPEFKGLEDFADEFLLASISKEGCGVDRMIQYEQAIGEKRIMQLGLRPQDQQKDKQKTMKE